MGSYGAQKEDRGHRRGGPESTTAQEPLGLGDKGADPHSLVMRLESLRWLSEEGQGGPGCRGLEREDGLGCGGRVRLPHMLNKSAPSQEAWWGLAHRRGSSFSQLAMGAAGSCWESWGGGERGGSAPSPPISFFFPKAILGKRPVQGPLEARGALCEAPSTRE